MKTMRIGEVAKRLGVSQRTIRFYEKKGLCRPQRTHNNYRVYSGEELGVLHFILAARAYGLSIKDIRVLISIKRKKGDICGEVLDIFEVEAERMLKEINRLKRIRGKMLSAMKKGSRPSCCKNKMCDIVEPSFHSGSPYRYASETLSLPARRQAGRRVQGGVSWKNSR